MLELVTYNLGSKNQFHQIVKSRNSKPVFQTQDPSPLQCNCLSLTGQCVLVNQPVPSRVIWYVSQQGKSDALLGIWNLDLQTRI